MPLPEHMHVQMRHAFSRIGPTINYDPKTVFKLELFCDFGRGQQQIAQQLAITCLGIKQTWQRPFRNNQHVNWCLRVNVTKRNQIFFFQHNVSWNFAGDDLLENRHGLTKRAV